MLYRITLIVIIGFALISCKEDNFTPNSDSEDLTSIIKQDNSEPNLGPVKECDEWLSAVEFKEAWEMMNASVHHEKNICFRGYVLSNETYGDLIQGTIAFESFEESDVVIPSVLCEFTGENSSYFLNYKIGDEIEIMGRLMVIDNPNKHNFKLTQCSLPKRQEDLEK